MHFTKLTEDRIRKTITKNNLFKPKDKVTIAVSGGKDSIAVCHFLSRFRNKMPMSLHGILIDEGVKGVRKPAIELTKKELDKLGIPYTVRSYKQEYGKNMDQIVKKASHPCSICGVLRRSLINKIAKEVKATKLATGHNLDDELQSSVMNFFRGDYGRMSRMGAKTDAQKGFVQRVKILRDVPEKEVGLYAIVNGYKFTERRCPFAKKALRQTIRDQINQVEEKHPGTKFAIMKSSENLNKILKPHFEKHKINLFKCTECGELSVSEICKKCKMLRNF